MKSTWKNPEEYDSAAENLVNLFKENFERYEEDATIKRDGCWTTINGRTAGRLMNGRGDDLHATSRNHRSGFVSDIERKRRLARNE